MPADFERCVDNDGKVRTVTGKKYGCGANEYRRICIDDNGKTHLGHIKKYKKET